MINNFLFLNNFEIIIGKKELVKSYNFDCNQVIEVEDLRSASFIGIGIKQNTGKNILILTNDEELSNGYTAFTEASFQNTDITVMLFQNSYRIDPLYNRCFSLITSFSENMIIKKTKGPVLIICPKIFCENIITSNIKTLNMLLRDYSGDIFCTKRIAQRLYNKKSIISFCGSMGIISTYVGLMVEKSENLICVCDERQLKLDLNICNCRYISDNFKLIVIGKPVAVEWMQENGFLVFERENIEEFFRINNKSICFVEGE